MDIAPITRNEKKLARTRFCQEEPDGGLTLRVRHIEYELGPDDLRDGLSFAQTWLHLTPKRWFTPEVAIDFVNVVQARWMAKAAKWI